MAGRRDSDVAETARVISAAGRCSRNTEIAGVVKIRSPSRRSWIKRIFKQLCFSSSRAKSSEPAEGTLNLAHRNAFTFARHGGLHHSHRALIGSEQSLSKKVPGE